MWLYLFSSILLLFVIITCLHSLLLPRPKKHSKVNGSPLVSILVPMRNEAHNVQGMVQALKRQSYSSIEVFFLDDESTDGTTEALAVATLGDSRLNVVQGAPKPDGWIGKVFACHQLSQHATGDYLLFLDADVRIEETAVSDVLALMQRKKLGLVSGFSRFLLPTFLNKLLVPLQHFIVLFHLPMVFARWSNWPPATAAHGGFMFFERGAYDSIGGHASVWSNIVEDVAISKQIKKQGHKMWLLNITEFVSCTMYDSDRDVWTGFSKNIFNGLGRSVPLALGISFFYGVFYVSPLFLAGAAFIGDRPEWLIPYALISLQAFVVYVTTREPRHLAFFIPFSALALIALLLYAMTRSLKGHQVEWKGRFYG